LLHKTHSLKWGMVITVHTVSGEDVTGTGFSATDEVKIAKDALAKNLGAFPSQLMLLHGATILKDTVVLEDLCGDNPPEVCLTVVVVPQLTGIFCFKTSCAFESLHLAGSNTSASIVAVFKDGTADIIVNEQRITSSDCDDEDRDDEDPLGAYGAGLARYVGVMRYMEHDDFNIDVTLCQRRGIYNDLLPATPSVIQGKWCTEEKKISLEIVLAAGGCKRLAAGKTWVTLQQRDKLPAEYARNAQEVTEVDLRAGRKQHQTTEASDEPLQTGFGNRRRRGNKRTGTSSCLTS